MAKRKKPAATVEGEAHVNGEGEPGLGAPNQGAPSADGEPGGGEGLGTYETRGEDDEPLEPEDDDLLDDEPSSAGFDEPTGPHGRAWEPSPAMTFGAGLGRFEPDEPREPPPRSASMRAHFPGSEPSHIPEPRRTRAFEPRVTGYEAPEDLPDPPGYEPDDNDSVPPGQPGLFGGGASYGQPLPKMPAWTKFTEYPGTHRLKVKRVEIDGRESDLGPVHANITEEELIARWPRPQTLLLYPIDNLGRNLAPNNPVRIDVAEDHVILQALRRRGRAGGMNGGEGGPWPAESSNKDVITLVQTMLENQKEENRRLREEMRARDERIERREAMLNERANQLRENETSLAVMNSDQLRTSQDKLITGFEQRNNGLIEILARNAAEERERRREEERADRERREENYRREKEERDARHQQEMALQREMFNQARARDEAWLERQRDADRREAERERLALEREEKRQERWAREQHAAMLERDKMRHEHMETLVAANGAGGIEKLAENIQALKSVTEELGGGGEGEGSGKGKIAEIGEALGDVVRAFKGVPHTVNAPGGGMGGGGMYDDDSGGPYGPPQLPGPPPGTLAIPPGYTVAVIPDPQTGQPTPVLVPMNAAAAAQGAAGQVQQQHVGQGGPGGQPGAPGQVINMPGSPAGSTNQLAQAAGMQLPEVKAARDVIRQTVRTLKQAPQDAWSEIVVAALAGSPPTISYLRAVSVFVAVKEGGADDILASDICLAAGPIAQQQGIPVRP